MPPKTIPFQSIPVRDATPPLESPTQIAGLPMAPGGQAEDSGPRKPVVSMGVQEIPASFPSITIVEVDVGFHEIPLAAVYAPMGRTKPVCQSAN
jgi:hypothetical protein